ncbi:MAG: RnfH family protein [Burkholderiales bacterium]
MGPDSAAEGPIRVEIAYSPQPGEVQRLSLTLPAGATVGQAVAQAIALGGWTMPEDIRVSVWGRQRAPTDTLRDRDRVELTRALRVDPKEARRQRYRSQRAAKP